MENIFYLADLPLNSHFLPDTIQFTKTDSIINPSIVF